MIFLAFLFMKKQKEKKGGIRDVLIVALPMLLSMSFDTLMTFTDRLFLARVGSEYMNAALSGGIAQIMALTFFSGLIGYSTALVAQNFGAGRFDNCAKVFTQAAHIAFIGAPLLLLIRPFAYKLLSFGEMDAIQADAQKIYFDILIYGSIFSLLRHSFSCFFSGIGETKIVMQAAFVGMLVNVSLNYVLIFGIGPFPELGIRGAAYGTIIGNFSSFAVLALVYFSKKNERRFSTRHSFGWHRELSLELLRKGSSSGLEMFLNMLAFQMLILLFHGLGSTVATASTVMFNWDMVSFVPLLGLEVAAMSLVGRYVGAKNFEAAHRATRSAVLLGWAYSTVIVFGFVLFPHSLVDMFRPEVATAAFTEARPLAIFMVRLASIYVAMEAILVVYAGALRGAGDTFWVLRVMVFLNWLTVFVLWLALYVFDLGPKIGWLTVVLGFVSFPFVLYLRFRSGKWKKAVA